jgi:hypothetical protein
MMYWQNICAHDFCLLEPPIRAWVIPTLRDGTVGKSAQQDASRANPINERRMALRFASRTTTRQGGFNAC